ncbi:hypothetical protein Vretimale_9596 [Volvox reticuliferus]|nr:hypothetical protein Vretifemale_19189 [Volvox reticuliferus]GIM05152.1 hypothetical protein Vretimale_9596 [Volvox reticuliferus]
MAATGVAEQKLGRPCEDTISLMVQWRNRTDDSCGTALYTASWVAAKGDCHTQQGFLYMGRKGELRIDQAHRGYSGASDTDGYASYNPLYMRYTPDANGRFAGQLGYGFLSIAGFLRAAAELNRGATSLGALRRQGELAMMVDSLPVTAILHAGRLSLDTGAPVRIVYDDTAWQDSDRGKEDGMVTDGGALPSGWVVPVGLEAEVAADTNGDGGDGSTSGEAVD